MRLETEDDGLQVVPRLYVDAVFVVLLYARLLFVMRINAAHTLILVGFIGGLGRQ